MSAESPKLTVSRSEAIDEKLTSIYINYMQMMLDAAKDAKFREELFSSNEKRVEYLNNKVGMTMPKNVHVVFVTKGLKTVKVYVKNKEGNFFIEEGARSLKIIDKLANGEVQTETMALTAHEEIDMDVRELCKESTVVVKLPFFDPTSDLLLFELKYDDNEIIFSTCIPL